MNCRGSVMQDRTGEPPAVMIAPPTVQGQKSRPSGGGSAGEYTGDAQISMITGRIMGLRLVVLYR